MPLPFIPIAAALLFGGTAAVGVGKTVKAVSDNKEAKRINENAHHRIREAKDTLERARKNTGDSITRLGKNKAEMLVGSVTRFLDSFTKIKNVDFTGSSGLNELKNFHTDTASFSNLRGMSNFASSLLTGTASGAAGGAIAAFGAYSAVTALGTASTGTAIAGLSGAAATNATLAFLGGGSLAAGGLGIAGGTAVLGGLVAGPALLVLGLITGSNASKNLDEAYSNAAKSKEIAAELGTAADACKAISHRADMFSDLLSRLDSYLVPLVAGMEKVISNYGTDFRGYRREHQELIAGAASVVGSIKAVLDTPILTEDGKLTSESEQLLGTMRAELSEKEGSIKGLISSASSL